MHIHDLNYTGSTYVLIILRENRQTTGVPFKQLVYDSQEECLIFETDNK